MSKNQKIYEQKLRLLLNQPSIVKHYIQRNQTPLSKSQQLRSIFPPAPQLQRFRHLQHARTSAQRDMALDGCVLDVIRKFEFEAQANNQIDRELEAKKENCLKKLKMDYVEQQMTQNLQQLQSLLKEHTHYSQLIEQEKGYVEKMIIITEIKKALTVQNGILKKENQILKKQEEEVDASISSKKKK